VKEFYYSTQPLEEPPTKRYFEYVFDMIDGPQTLMYASDYPHPDYDEPNVITDLPFLDDHEKAAILGGNAEEVFGI
jgi:predicted TIM-barrel fold metal-dependent hydrolase